MGSTIKERISELLLSNKRHTRYLAIFACMALVVALGVAGMLRQDGTAMTHEMTVLDCQYSGNAAHTHVAECYDADGNLVCPLEERELHTHTDECYQETSVLVCGQEESDEHVHDDSCYETVRELVCGKEEVTEEHVHGSGCFKTVDESEVAAEQAAAYPEQELEKALTKIDEDGNEYVAAVVNVKAPTGALPAGTSLEFKDVDGSEESVADIEAKTADAIERDKGDDALLAQWDVVDFGLYDQEGNEIAPNSPVEVKLTSAKAGEIEQPVLVQLTDHEKSERSEDAVVLSQADVVNQDGTPAEDGDTFKFETNELSPFVICEVEIITGEDQTFVAEDGDVSVTVHTPAGAFDAGTEMTITKVNDPETLAKMAAALGNKVYSIKAVDISFTLDGVEVEPRVPVEVSMRTPLSQSSDYKIVHLKDDNTTEVINDADVNTGGADFTLSSFSAVGAAAIEQDSVPKEGFTIYYGNASQGSPSENLTPGAFPGAAPEIPGYVFVNATVGGDSVHAGTKVVYTGSFISEGTQYIYYRTETDNDDLIVHVENGEHIALNYLPEDNYYNITYRVTGDTSEISGDPLDYVFGTDRVMRAEKQTGAGYTVTIPRGYTATITRNNSSVASLGTEPTYTVSSNNKVITKHGELELDGTYNIPSTSANQTITVNLVKRNSFTFDASKFLSTVYTGGNSTTMGDSAVNTNSNARVKGDGSLGRTGNNKGKKTFTGNEVSWSFTTNNTESSHWLMDALQINGTDINVPYGESGPVSKTTNLPSGAVVTVTLNSVTGSGRNARRNYTITVSNVYEDVVISGGNIYNADNSTEIISEVLNNVDYSFYGFDSSDNAYSSSVRPGWVEWGEGEPIAVGPGSLANYGTYDMYRFGQTNNNAMRFTVKPGYINPELAFVTSTEGDLHSNVSLGNGLSFGSMSDNNGKYYPISGNPTNGYYYFRITGIGNNNKLALLRIRATLAVYGVTYEAGSYNGTAIHPEAGTLSGPDMGEYNVETNPEFVVTGAIPIDDTGQHTFTHWTIKNDPSNKVYAPGESVNIEDVYHLAVDDGNGNLVIPFVAHWETKDQAPQVNYKIEFYIEGQDDPKFTYNMQAPKDSAIYVNRDSHHISNVIEIYENLLEYDEAGSAQYVDHIEEGSVVKLRFKWVRFPVTIEKVVDSVNADDKTKDFEFTAVANRTYNIHPYDPATETIDEATEEPRTEDPVEYYTTDSPLTLGDGETAVLKKDDLDVKKGSKVTVEELADSAAGFNVSYTVTTYAENGATIASEQAGLTAAQVAEIPINAKTKITAVNARGKIQVNKTVRVGEGGTIQQSDISTTIYFALKKHGESEFVKDAQGNILVQAITVTNGQADANYVTFTGIEDGTYDVWECRNASGKALKVGDVFEAGDKQFQLSRIIGTSSDGTSGNNAIVTNGGTAKVSFTNIYTDVNENIEFKAHKKWMDRQAREISAPTGAEVVFGIYKEEDGQTVPVMVESGGQSVPYTITLDGETDANGEYEAWGADFTNLPKLDAEGRQIVYKVKELSCIPTGFRPYNSQTPNGTGMGPNDYITNNGGTIWNRKLTATVRLQKHVDFQPNGDKESSVAYEYFQQDKETQKKLHFTLTLPNGVTASDLMWDNMPDGVSVNPNDNRQLLVDLNYFHTAANTQLELDLPDMPAGTYTLNESGFKSLLDEYNYYFELSEPGEVGGTPTTEGTVTQTRTVNLDYSTTDPTAEVHIHNQYRRGAEGKVVRLKKKVTGLTDADWEANKDKFNSLYFVIQNDNPGKYYGKYYGGPLNPPVWDADTKRYIKINWVDDLETAKANAINAALNNYNKNDGAWTSGDANLNPQIELPTGTYTLLEFDSNKNEGPQIDGYELAVSGNTLEVTSHKDESGHNTICEYTMTVTNTYTRELTDVEVTKTFSGITRDLIPSDFQIANTAQAEKAFTLQNADSVSADGLTYTWKLSDVPVGTEVMFTESNYTVQGYDWTGSDSDLIKTITLVRDKTQNKVEFTNSYVPSSVAMRLYKHDMTDETKPLEATFELYKEADIADGKPKPGATPVTTFVTSPNGYSANATVQSGTYYLIETVAPDGYNKMANPWIVTINTAQTEGVISVAEGGLVKDGVVEFANDVYTVKVPNNSGTELPMTGGPGTNLFTIIGTAMIVGALMYCSVSRRRSERRSRG